MRLLICAGGTGGGVYPAITVLDSLGISHQAVLWVGSQGGMEETLVTRREIPFTAISAAGIHGVGLARLPGNILKLIKGFFTSIKILHDFQPDALLFTGGFVAFPMAVASVGKPSLLYVPDIEPGLALRSLARFANRIAITTTTSKAYFPNQSKLTVTGYPVRADLKTWTREKAIEYFGLNPALPTLTVAGGSQGARSINFALIKILPQLLQDMQIIHLAGHLDWEKIDTHAQSLHIDLAKRYHPFPYLHEIGAALAAADLVVSRAGASTLGEYPLFGLPAILVPYPHAWRYQKVNASYLAERGAAVILNDEELEDQLLNQIQSLISNQDKLTNMHQAMSTLAAPDAAEKIANLIMDMTETNNTGRSI